MMMLKTMIFIYDNIQNIIPWNIASSSVVPKTDGFLFYNKKRQHQKKGSFDQQICVRLRINFFISQKRACNKLFVSLDKDFLSHMGCLFKILQHRDTMLSTRRLIIFFCWAFDLNFETTR
jgi:hypothetical protein